MTEETKSKIESYIYEWPESVKEIMRREIAFGYSLATDELQRLKKDLDVMVGNDARQEEEIERLKILIKEGFVLLQQQWKKSLGQIDADWEKFKTDNKL